ncbi:MAG: glycosyltransferase family 1 protein [Chloroflexia bacterium]|nr:glycosyltransferase family 1 protein [Chloroflexia bacterium]
MTRIGVDARLNAYRQGGIAQYTRQLLGAMAALAPDLEFVALQHYRQREPLAVAPNLRRATMITPPHHRYEQLSLPLELWTQRLSLLHCPDFIAPRRRRCPAVITIHDLAFLHYPDILDADARRFYAQIRAAAHDADGVITVSEATRNDIVSLLDLPAEQITVIYEAADPSFQPLGLRPDATRTINGHQLTATSFLLFVSTIEPRKNLETLLHALRLLLDRDPGVPYQLVAAGAPGWLDEPIYRLVRELHLADHVWFAGKVAHDELIWLYNACRLYLNPSLYEGFGLPMLEALACGAPTIVADTSSLPEIVGKAGICVPPQDPAAWADTIAALWHDEAARTALVRRGPPHAARFTWQRAAQETLAVYRSLL